MILSDIDGLYDKNPSKYADAKLIPVVKRIDAHILSMAEDASSNVGTGGMITNLHAAQYANEHNIPMIIANGKQPSILYDILEDNYKGTLFDI